MKESKAKILIAEDELLIAMDIKQKLEELSYDVTSLVNTALEAIAKVDIDKPDLILMDVQLGGALTGIEAADIISYKNKLPIIFLADKDNEHLILEAKNNISHNVIIKPVEVSQLKLIIEKTLLINSSKTEISNKPAQPSSFTY